MKKLLPVILLATVMLAGCASQSTKMTDDQLFQKKQECVKYKSEIEKAVSLQYPLDKLNDNLYVEDIFYSKTRNSCMYRVELIYGITHTQYIVDYLDKKTIETCFDTDYKTDCYEMIKGKVQELKGE